MTSKDNRRQFLAKGTVATMGAIAGGLGTAAATARGAEDPATGQAKPPADKPEEGPADGFSRYHPSRWGTPGGRDDRGRLVPGLRKPGLPPVPIQTPDIPKAEWKMVNGVKEFHLHAMAVRRELLPGWEMDLWGYDGTMPGPTIEANQGDRVRIVVHNDLPEPTSMHWHGFELPVAMDGVQGVTQEFIPPGGRYVYEFDLHQTGTYFYHSHVPMQEAFGMVGFFIIHPPTAYEPVVDRDFGLIFQNFHIPPNQTVADTMAMDWNWHTINGRSGPYTTPLVTRHGERVRIRLLDFSPMQHHPIHIHGHTFWITATEGGRIPPEAWVPANTVLVAVAQVFEFEFVANNPGDWLMHCHMVHHMMNHMVKQVGPRIRNGRGVDAYLESLDERPRVGLKPAAAGFQVPGYPQKMQGMMMSESAMQKIHGRREARGMRHNWHIGVHGLMTVVRVLPDDLFDLVMQSDRDVAPGQVFDEIVRRTS